MKRKELQHLAAIRMPEATALLASGCFEGAYYLGGYAAECALKACIAKQTAMAKDVLVTPDIELGSGVLALLDKANLPIPVALWMLNEEFGGWRLVLVSPTYDREGPKAAYLQVLKVLAATDPDLVNRVPIKLVGGRHRLIRDLRRMFGKTASVEGMRLGGQNIGGIWVEDAFVYRIQK